MYENRPEMDTPQYKALRFAVLSRDNFTCVMCSKKGVRLNVHHIVRWVDSEALRYVTGNCVAICETCHQQVTGHEKEYEDIFKRHVEQKKIQKTGKASPKAKNKYRGKWRKLNPRQRY